MSESRMKVSQEGDLIVVEFEEETNLNTEEVERIRPELYTLVEEHAGGRVVLDLGNVAFASSMALGCLVTLRLKAARTQARVALTNIRPSLADIFEMTHLNTLFETYPERADALAQMT